MIVDSPGDLFASRNMSEQLSWGLETEPVIDEQTGMPNGQLQLLEDTCLHSKLNSGHMPRIRDVIDALRLLLGLGLQE